VGNCRSGRGWLSQNAPCRWGGPRLPGRSYTGAHCCPAVRAATIADGSCRSGQGWLSHNAPYSLGGHKLPGGNYGTVAHPSPAVRAGTIAVGSCQSGQGLFSQDAHCSWGGPELPGRNYGTVAGPRTAVREQGGICGQLPVRARLAYSRCSLQLGRTQIYITLHYITRNLLPKTITMTFSIRSHSFYLFYV
jgi:hypothetical protein